jgi:hypothetical protein
MNLGAIVEVAIGIAPDRVLVQGPRTIPRTSNGKIEVTLSNGSVLVLYGEAVEQFLAGYAESLEQALAPAAGWSEVQRILTPLESIAPPRRDDMEDEEEELETESDAAGSLRNDGFDDLPSSGNPTFAGAAPSQDFTTLDDGPINHAPIAVSDSYSIDEDTALVISLPGVLSNDSDADGDPLSAALVSGPAGDCAGCHNAHRVGGNK